MKLTEQGFTLIESLFVLAIFLVITSITAFSIKPQYETIEGEAFVNQLQADLYYAQQYAISHQQEVAMNIIPEQHYYYIRSTYSWPPFVYRNYSNTISVSPGTLPLSFKITPSGNVNQSGSFNIQSERKHYRLTILIGKGKFYVIEE